MHGPFAALRVTPGLEASEWLDTPPRPWLPFPHGDRYNNKASSRVNRGR